MLLQKENLSWDNFADATSCEWLETNGLGGWAGSTLCGANTRRYHGLLMASVKPPTERMLLVSKLDETFLVAGQRFNLATNDYGSAISPQGFHFLRSFKRDFFPEWTYEAGGIRLHKTITMVHEENTTLIRYEILRADHAFVLELLPLIAARPYHGLQSAANNLYWKTDFAHGIFHNQPYGGAPHIYISVPGASYNNLDEWYRHFHYKEETSRGLDDTEDLFNHGIFRVPVKAGDVLWVIISTENPEGRDAAALFEREKQRKFSAVKTVAGDLHRQLALAADQFIVERSMTSGEGPVDADESTNDQRLTANDKRPTANDPRPKANGERLTANDLRSIIAGYPWFTDWGRDTMISMPGLCLSTGRFDDAKRILSVFAGAVSEGMLPNRFPDYNFPPEYNTVDATLWFFHCVYEYLGATGDRDFVLYSVLPVMKEIIRWHIQGTRFNIRVDEDGLLHAGAVGQQLTWMDAKVDGQVITPRIGKPVEIQSLWYNALIIYESLLRQSGETAEADQAAHRSALTARSFTEKFWNAEKGCLYDVIGEGGITDGKIRPNQLLALSLSFPLVEGEKAKSILRVVKEKLYTPMGLRTLSPDDPDYKGRYEGNQLQRDSAYHQGTVWPWLLGPYVDAAMKNFGSRFLPEATAIISRLAPHLNEACVGSVSEIFDGDPPHTPRGCPAQAWSVAEILRLMKRYSLYHAKS